MLIKATRIRATAGAAALARHLLQGDDNEEIVVLRGTIADLHDAVVESGGAKLVHGSGGIVPLRAA